MAKCTVVEALNHLGQADGSSTGRVLGLDLARIERGALAERARAFALERHGAHRHADPSRVAHLDEVHAIAAACGLPETVRVAAYLHELLSDTDTSEEEILERFGPDVLVLVDGVTGRGATSQQRLDDVAHKLRAFPPAILLEMCDRLAGTWQSARDGSQSLLQRYRAEWPTLQPVFAQMRNPAPALYQRLLDISEGAGGFYAGDRVRLVKVPRELTGSLKPGDTGIVESVQETFQPERMIRVRVEGQSEARSLWPDEVAHAQ
ncbi:MAG TPA: HD domain-containing protein [Steroidobacteraceae bacterium]|nr:HD domain-containing protein [Steroidobacteraceae bacterium]